MSKEKSVCGVCLETKSKTQKIRLNCGHEFCKACLKKCIHNSHLSCPNCRAPLNFSPDNQLYQKLLCQYMFGSHTQPPPDEEQSMPSYLCYWRFQLTTGVKQYCTITTDPRFYERAVRGAQHWYYICYDKGIVGKSDKYRWDISSWKQQKITNNRSNPRLLYQK